MRRPGGLAADALAPRRVGERVFPIAQAYVTKTLLGIDAAIRQAQHALWRTLRAAEPVGVLISGGNTTAVNFDA
jgi:threonine dehydratase